MSFLLLTLTESLFFALSAESSELEVFLTLSLASGTGSSQLIRLRFLLGLSFGLSSLLLAANPLFLSGKF